MVSNTLSMEYSAVIKDYSLVEKLRGMDGVRLYDLSYRGKPGYGVILLHQMLIPYVYLKIGPIDWRKNV